MLTVVVTGHGHFATGMKSMLDLVLGGSEETCFIDFSEGMSVQDLKRKFEEMYTQKKGNIVFLCDISGGTPFNQASILMYEHGQNGGVIGGISIPLILEVLDARESSSDVQQILNQGRIAAHENIKIFGEENQSNDLSSDEEDGI